MKHLLKLLLVVSCLACSQTLPSSVQTPKVSLREAVCKTDTLLQHLGNEEGLVQRVLDGTMSVDDAVYFIGGLSEDAGSLRDALKRCEKVVAPPPQPGNKVL